MSATRIGNRATHVQPDEMPVSSEEIERWFDSQGAAAFDPPPPVEVALEPVTMSEATDVVDAVDEPEEVHVGDLLVGLRDPRKPAAKKVRESDIVRFAADVLGLKLWPRQMEILYDLVASPARIAVWRLGRRSGKGLMSAVFVTWSATANLDAYRAQVRDGERLTFMLLANSKDQAAEGFRTIAAFFDRPELAPLVARRTGDTIELKSGAAVVVMPTSARTVRGRATPVVVLDELAHAVDASGIALSPQAASEIVDAVLPGTLQFEHGVVLVTSTPRWPSGTFHELSMAAENPLRPDVTGVHLATVEINPTLGPEAIKAMAADPARFAREVLARFDASSGALFPHELVMGCVASRGDYRPAHGVRYIASLDPAANADAAVLVIAHLDHRKKLIVDLVRGWQGRKGRPLDYTAFLDDVAGLVRTYGATLSTDQWANAPITAGLRERGVSATTINWTSELKAEAVRHLRSRFVAQTIELPSHVTLINELTALESRPLPGGGQRIAAPPGLKDDHALALLGVTVMAHEGRGGRVITAPSPWD